MTKKHLFVIGKNKDAFTFLQKTFSQVYDVCSAENKEQAINYIKENGQTISTIFIAQNPKSDDVFKILATLSEQDLLRRFPTFLVTDDCEENFLSDIYHKGIIDVIQMPINSIIIEHRIKNIIELFENRKQMEQLFNDQSELIAKQLVTLQKNQWAIIETLGNALESRDVESGDHVFRVKTITHTLAVNLAINHPEYMLNGTKIELITLASTLHDIGKIAIPDNILRKPETAGRLTAEEYGIMKTHTIEGCKVIDSIPDFKDSALYPYCYEICRHHHERWDGRGYPDGLSENDIPISAQLVSIADVYDALISKRAYKPALTHKKTCKMILSGDCGVFNPDIIECFENTIDKINDDYYVKNIHRAGIFNN